MRKLKPHSFRSIYLLLFLLPAFSNAAERSFPATDGGDLSDDERADLIALLEGAERDLLQKIADLDDAAFAFKPHPDRWSIGEVVEHLILSEELFFGRASKAMDADPDPEWARATAGKEDRLYRVVPLRLRQFQAPAGVQPRGEMGRRKLIRTFEKARARTLAFIRDTAEPIKAHTFENDALGPLNAHQWVVFAALHNLRHNQQVVEILADPAFPH